MAPKNRKDLVRFLGNFHPVDDSLLNLYVNEWTNFTTKRKTILTSQGQTERYLYFTIEGIQKSYYLFEGKQYVMFFAYPPSFSGVVESFFTQTPSHYYLEAITKSDLLRISYQKHCQLIEKHRELDKLFRKVTEMLLKGVIERHHELLAFNAETRMQKFLSRSPHLFNMIPQKDIASYLRIDPTNFSKMIKTIQW